MSGPMSGEVGAPADPIARCYRHPTRETGVRCVRCDRPICPDCMRPASVGFQCPDDVRLGQVDRARPRTAVGARIGSGAPIVTWSIVGINVLVYLASAIGSPGGLNNPTQSRLFTDWQLFPYAVHQNHQYWRLLTSAFLHVSLLHIAVNMLALWIIGPYLERLLGPARYLGLYLLSALGGSVAVYLFGAQLQGVAGASGAIFGLFAAALIFVRELGLDPRSLIMTLVLNFIFTFAVADISRLGHIGGFLTGAAAAFAIGGLPKHRGKLANNTQAALLLLLLAVLILAVAWRTATFPTLID
ncbi:membrane associated rhomboid family serine protease [Jatrophihabitans sp. GAS493]|nr:membrane associated rhomboid family serine protease [Jatrophihabitans sp. GAS493]